MSKEYLEAFKNLKQELYYSPNQIPDIDKWHETIEKALQRLEAIDNANPSELLMAKKYGFFDGYSMWRNEEFVIDYDTVRKEFCLRSITNRYSLGKTRFYESDYKKTWWLKKDKSE